MPGENFTLVNRFGEVLSESVGLYVQRRKMTESFAYCFPAGVWWLLANDLKYYEMKMLLALVALQDLGGQALLDMRLVHSISGLHPSNQSAAVRELVSKGVVFCVGQRGRSKVYRVNPWLSFKGSAQQLESVRKQYAPPTGYESVLDALNKLDELRKLQNPLPAPPLGECATSDLTPSAEDNEDV